MNKLAVIVQSCDKYSDVWNPFYTLFFRYWSDCTYPIYHLSETRKFEHSQVLNISAGDGTEWSERLIVALNQIKEKYVLLLLEDYLLMKIVKNSDFEECIAILENENAAYLRIFPVPPADFNYKGYHQIGLVDLSKPYAFSTQATIWDKEVLLENLRPNESVWDFELKGSERAKSIQKPLLSYKDTKFINNPIKSNYPYFYLCTAVYKGEWMQEAIAFCKKEGISIDHKYRKTESNFDRFYRLNYNRFPIVIKHVLDFIRNKSKSLA